MLHIVIIYHLTDMNVTARNIQPVGLQFSLQQRELKDAYQFCNYYCNELRISSAETFSSPQARMIE